MILRRRTFIAATAAAISGVAMAQTASGTIKIIVPYPPGQGIDMIMRLLSDSLSRRLKQPIIVDNKPGAGGVLGTDYAIKQPADGLTLFAGSSGSLSVAPTLQAKVVRYNPVKDAEPITGIASVAQAMVVTANSPFKNLGELVAAAKENPGKLAYGSSGNGSTQHLFMESFAHTAGIKLMHVPYKGAGPAFADLMGGHLAVMFDTIPALVPQIKSGAVRALGVTSAKRFPGLPDTPAISERYKGWQAEGWITLMGPAGMRPELADRYDHEVRASLREPAIAQKLKDMGFVEMQESRGDLRKFIQAELIKWKTVIDTAGISSE